MYFWGPRAIKGTEENGKACIKTAKQLEENMGDAMETEIVGDVGYLSL